MKFHQSNAFKISVFVVAVCILGALLAPMIYDLGQMLVERGTLKDGPLNSIHESMERAKFSRYFNRAILVSALLLIFPAILWIRGPKNGCPDEKTGTRSQRLLNWLLLKPNSHRFLHLSSGFHFAAGTLLGLGMIYIIVGYYRFWDERDPIIEIFFSAIGSALAVSLLEEFVFRGALFALVLRTVSPLKTLLFLSAFFALVHFLKPPEGLEMPLVTWSTGFWMLGQIFGQFGDWRFLAAEFSLLFTVGLILGYARLKTQSLWLGIGLHAGWVFGIKAYSSITRKNAPLAEMLPWAGPNLKIGFWSFVVVLATGVTIWIFLRTRIKRSSITPIIES